MNRFLENNFNNQTLVGRIQMTTNTIKYTNNLIRLQVKIILDEALYKLIDISIHGRSETRTDSILSYKYFTLVLS